MPQVEEHITLPATAISYNPYGDSVYLVTAGDAGDDGNRSKVAERVFVKIGDRRGDQVSVLEGVDAGAQVVTSGQLKLRNGSRLNINNDVTPDNNPKPNPANK